jgi:hypothetical protein
MKRMVRVGLAQVRLPRYVQEIVVGVSLAPLVELQQDRDRPWKWKHSLGSCQRRVRAVERCLFLLELNSPVSSQHDAPAAEHNEEEKLKQLGMSRCPSH